MGYRMARMMLFGRVKNGILGFCAFLCKLNAKKLASFAERRQKSWAQHIIFEQASLIINHLWPLNVREKTLPLAPPYRAGSE